MLTKGYIVELSTSTNNKFKVRIPLFDSAGQDTLTNEDNIVEATLCYEPSNLDSYEVGDCVFIEFENDEESKPVIIGKLYTTDSKENRGLGNLSTLNVSSSATLPLDSTLGDVKLQAIIDSLKLSKANSDRIDQLDTGGSEKINELTKLINNEISERKNADTELQTNIDKEIEDRISNDEELLNSISTLENQLNDETSNRENADNELKAYVESVKELIPDSLFLEFQDSNSYQFITSDDLEFHTKIAGVLATEDYVTTTVKDAIASAITNVLNTSV